MRRLSYILGLVFFFVAHAAFAQSPGTINICGPSRCPGNPQIGDTTINNAVNPALGLKIDTNGGVATNLTINGGNVPSGQVFTVPTAPAGTNTTQAASTAFVNVQAPAAAWSGTGFGFSGAPSAASVGAAVSTVPAAGTASRLNSDIFGDYKSAENWRCTAGTPNYIAKTCTAGGTYLDDGATLQAAFNAATRILIPKNYYLLPSDTIPTATNDLDIMGLGPQISGIYLDPSVTGSNSDIYTVGQESVTGATLGSPGTGGTNGACVLTGTSGALASGGAYFQVAGTVSGGQLQSVGSVISGGAYISPPKTGLEFVTSNCGLTSAQLNLTLAYSIAHVKLSYMTFGGNWGAPDPNNPGQFLYSQVGNPLVLLKGVDNVELSHVRFQNSRAFTFQTRFSRNVDIGNYEVLNSVRDGIAVWDTFYVNIHDGYQKGGNDSAISLHVDSDATQPRTSTRVSNITLVDTSSIDTLGAKILQVDNIICWRSHGACVTVGGYVPGSQGDTSNWGISLQNIQSYDPIQGSFFFQTTPPTPAPANAQILINSTPWSAGSLGAVPMQNVVGSGTIAAVLGTYYNNGVLAGGLPSPPSQQIDIGGVVIRQTLPPVANYSDWGYGKAFGGTVGWLDGPITQTMTTSHGMEFRGPIWDMRVHDFHIADGSYGLRFTCTTSGTICASGWPNNLFRRVVIEDGTITNSPVDCVQFFGQGTVPSSQDIEFNHVTFDCDSEFTASTRGANGKWASTSPYAIDSPYVSGMRIVNSSFRDLAIPVNETGIPANTNYYLNDTIYAYPAFPSFSPSNAGVAKSYPDDQQWQTIFEYSDPTLSNFRTIAGVPSSSSASMPVTGCYTGGSFVMAQNTSYGPSGEPAGWSRITTGCNHNPVSALAIVNAGTGGTPGTYALIFTSTNGSGAAGTFTVGAGGTVTGTSLTNGGNSYQASLPPTISLANAPGLTGASVTASVEGDWAQTYAFWGGPGSPYKDNIVLSSSNGGLPSVSSNSASSSIVVTPTGTGSTVLTAALKSTGLAPTISANFGTSPTIAGNNTRSVVTVGTGGATQGTILFNPGQPLTAGSTSCTAVDNTTSPSTSGSLWAQVSASGLSVTVFAIGGTMQAGDKIVVNCGA